MSRVCSELRRIFQTSLSTTGPATKPHASRVARPATAAQPPASKPRASKATRPATAAQSPASKPRASKDTGPTSTTPISKLFTEPSIDTLVSKFKTKSVSSTFRNKFNVYVYTIDRLAKHKRFSAIEDILEAHKEYKEITTEGYAVRLITLYGTAGMYQHAHKLFDELPELKCHRTVMSFNALLGAALHSKELEQVCELFRQYPSKLGFVPDVFTYNTVIKALVELGSVDEAVSMIDEMKYKDLEPNLITFNSLVDGVYRKKGLSEGDKVWNLMVEKINGLVPDIKSYNAKLNGMINEGKVYEAVDLFEEIKIRGLSPNTFTFNHLIKGFCDKEDLEEAKKWYMKMIAGGLLPNWITFETLVTFLCNNGDTDLASELSISMLGRHFLVDEVLLQMVVDKLVSDSKVEMAKKLVGLAGVNFYHQYNLAMPSVE